LRANADPDTYSNSISKPNGDVYSYSDSHGYLYAYANCYGDSDGYRYGNVDGYRYGNPAAYPDAETYSRANAAPNAAATSLAFRWIQSREASRGEVPQVSRRRNVISEQVRKSQRPRQ